MQLSTAALEAALTLNERSGNASRAAHIALFRGDARRAARILDRLPTYVRSPKALPDSEQVVSRLSSDQIASYPSLWIATMPFRRFSIDLVTYLREAQRVYYCLPDDSDVRLRTDALLHLAAALYQSAELEETEAILRDALATYASAPTDERRAILSFIASIRELQGRFSEARALQAQLATMRDADFLSDLGLHYVDAHEAFARGRYQRGSAIVEESLRRRELDGYAALLRTELDAEPPAELFAIVNAARQRHPAHTSATESNGAHPAEPGQSRRR